MTKVWLQFFLKEYFCLKVSDNLHVDAFHLFLESLLGSRLNFTTMKIFGFIEIKILTGVVILELHHWKMSGIWINKLSSLTVQLNRVQKLSTLLRKKWKLIKPKISFGYRKLILKRVSKVWIEIRKWLVSRIGNTFLLNRMVLICEIQTNSSDQLFIANLTSITKPLKTNVADWVRFKCANLI